MEEGGIISGRVICHERNPVVGAWVSVHGQDHGQIWNEAYGYYTITSLAAGTYQMMIYPQLHLIGVNMMPTHITDIEVTTGKTTTVEVTMRKGELPVVPVTRVTLAHKTATINISATQLFTAVVEPENATNKAVSDTSSYPVVATVDANGLVTAVGAGEAVITIITEDGNFSATSMITVVDPASKPAGGLLRILLTAVTTPSQL